MGQIFYSDITRKPMLIVLFEISLYIIFSIAPIIQSVLIDFNYKTFIDNFE